MTQILEDGHPTTLTFSLAPTIKLKEQSTTPPGVVGGGENDITSHRNVAWRTKAPKKLKTLSEGGATVFFDPEVYDDIIEMIQKNQLLTNTFSDGDALQFWGWLEEFVPGDHVEGEPPTADIVVIPSNRNNAGAEVGPVRVPAGATTTTA